jgi:hypothetical protein
MIALIEKGVENLPDLPKKEIVNLSATGPGIAFVRD